MAVVGDGIKGLSGTDALIFIIDDDTVEVMAIKSDLDLAAAKIHRRFKAKVFQGKGIVGFDGAVFFEIKQFIIGFAGRQKADAGQVQAEVFRIYLSS